MPKLVLVTVAALLLASPEMALSFSSPLSSGTAATSSNTRLAASRRSVFGSAVAQGLLLLGTSAAAPAAEVRGTAVTPFNALAFQYRGTDNPGLQKSDLEAAGEKSVPYSEFLEQLAAGEVEFVEFLAPAGDAAYATFKNSKTPIRIGEGYPIEDPNGWSSPTFVVRAVKNKGVPYKFTVPALAKFQQQ